MQSQALTRPSTIAINGHPLPLCLADAIDDGSWMSLSAPAGRVLGERFAIRCLFPELFDFYGIVRATSFFTSTQGAPYWPGGLDTTLDMDPTSSVLIGDLVGAGEDFLALDFRHRPNAAVRLLTYEGWELVAESVPELIGQLDQRR